MDEMEEKLGAILGNPQLMQQIMSMAQSMGSPAQSTPPPPKSPPPTKQESGFPDMDLSAIQKITGLAQRGSIDKREKALLSALGAYLSKERLNKLEKAMRAAKIAQAASSALNQRGNPRGR